MVGFPGRFKYVYLALQARLLSYHVQSCPMTCNKLEQGAKFISTQSADEAGLGIECNPLQKVESQVSADLSLADYQGKQQSNSFSSKLRVFVKRSPPSGEIKKPSSIDTGVNLKTKDNNIIKFSNHDSEKETHADHRKEFEAFPKLIKAVVKLEQSNQKDFFENLQSLTDGFEEGMYGDDGDAALLMFLKHYPFKSNDLIIWQHLQVFMAKSLMQNRMKQDEIEEERKIRSKKGVKSVENQLKRVAQLQTNEKNIIHLYSTFTSKVVKKIESVVEKGQLSTFIANQEGLPGYLHQTKYEGGQEKLWLFWPQRIEYYVFMKEDPTFVEDTDAVICTSGKEQTKNFFHYLDKLAALDHQKSHSQAEMDYMEFFGEWFVHTHMPIGSQVRFGLYVLARCDYKFWKHWHIGQRMTGSFTGIASKLRSKARKARARLGTSWGSLDPLRYSRLQSQS
ncbi:hypothetical protein CROQUDRAFT_673719 [Cronartium quercuum f. sp. fusiforme G11]|uniref:Uncharacterized protein n=1 Tax=Cronartium quercuum f. sp. fusiforme G11 TaxID=708437 RepID=A0A9P6T7J9_9BASI|nr:hypothetical protein CROQUDRAFT_673719 [Cronartium quercuum f. sp. fusiforme G11]